MERLPSKGNEHGRRADVPAAGDVIEGYRLVAPIGTGASGTVWRAEGPEGPCALKLLNPALVRPRPVGGPWIVDRFLEEARLLRQLDHPGLVRVLDVVFRVDLGRVAIVLEHLRGTDLAHAATSLALDEVLEVGAAIARTLEILDAHGIVHRDVKPGNVFVVDGPEPIGRRVKLLDFGVAKDMLGGTVDETATGVMVGTLLAQAPEAIRRSMGQNISLDGAADQWALGVTLYLCASGRLPFSGSDPATVIDKILRSPHEPLSLDPRFPAVRAPAIRALIDRTLSKDRRDRFPTLDALADALTVLARQVREDAAGSESLTEPEQPPIAVRPAPPFFEVSSEAVTLPPGPIEERFSARRAEDSAATLAPTRALSDRSMRARSRSVLASESDPTSVPVLTGLPLRWVVFSVLLALAGGFLLVRAALR
ncbi:MAG: serine/threonine protein kinase [Deltaproteobacteria bacterium]|nr:serine/threonine protein kinase [Deltaproteobacteria bacterium]